MAAKKVLARRTSAPESGVDEVTLASADLTDGPCIPVTAPPMISAGCLTEPVFTDLGTGYATLAAVAANIYATSDFLGQFFTATIPGTTLGPFPDNVESYIVIKYNAGSPIFFLETVKANINCSDVVGALKVWRTGSTLHSLTLDAPGSGLAGKLQEATFETNPYALSTDGGLVPTETTSPAARTIVVSGGTLYSGGVKTIVNDFTSATDIFTLAYHSAPGVWAYTNQTVYDNENIDNGSAVVAGGSNKYLVRWHYRSIGDVNQVFYVLGSDGTHTSITSASQEPPRTDLNSMLLHHCKLVGRSIVQKGATSGVTQSIVPTLQLSQAINHNDTANISDAPGSVVGQHVHLSTAQGIVATQAATVSLDGYLSSTNFAKFYNLTGSYAPDGTWHFTDTTDTSPSTPGLGSVIFDGGVLIYKQLRVAANVWCIQNVDATAEFGITNQNSGAIGNAAKAACMITGDLSTICQIAVFGSARTTVVFGKVIASWAALFCTGVASTNGLLIGVQGVDKPIVFGIGSTQVAEFTGETLATNAYKLFYTQDCSGVGTGSFQTPGGGYFGKKVYSATGFEGSVGAAAPNSGAFTTGTFSTSITFPTLPVGTNTTGGATTAHVRASLPTAMGDGITPTFCHDGVRPVYLTGWQGTMLQYATARTALMTYSATFTNWTQTNIALTAAQPSADGGTTAFLFADDATSGVHEVHRTSASLPAGLITVYAIVKAGTGKRFTLREGSTTGAAATFDVSTGVVVSSEAGSGGAGGVGSIVALPLAGWYRCSLTFTSAGGAKAFYFYMLADAGTSYANRVYVGTGQTLNVMCYQVEASSVATSYIPTAAATVAVTDYATLAGTLTFATAPIATDVLNGVASENPASREQKARFTPSGGFAVKLTNKTGGNSVKGEIVRVNSGANNSVTKTIDTAPDCVGAFYESGIADGAEAWVVVSGIADVYFIGNTTRGNFARTFVASEAGYVTGQAIAEAVPSAPFATDKHFCEIGHVLETRTGAGLAKCVLHFN